MPRIKNSQPPCHNRDNKRLHLAWLHSTSNTNPNSAISASLGVAGVPGFTDDEIYAGGPIEENALKAADTSKDWASPGNNKKP